MTTVGTHEFFYRLGRSLAGPLYVGFARFVRDQAEALGVERTYFLARDGYPVHRAFSMLYGEMEDARYLYASRRALNFPAITSLDENALAFLTSGPSGTTVSDFLTRISLDPAEHASSIRGVGFTAANDAVVESTDYARLSLLLQRLSSEIIDAAADERHRLIAFLEQERFFDQGRAAVVDLGWHGSLQTSLCDLSKSWTGSEPDLVGLYLGTYSNAIKLADRGRKSVGWLFDLGEPAHRETMLRTGIAVVEFLFAAPHDSVIGFRREAEAIVPVLGPTDADPNTATAIRSLHAGAFDFVRDEARDESAHLSAEAAFDELRRLLSSPTREEAAYIGALSHSEGFGSTTARRSIAAPRSLFHYATSPRRLVDDRERSLWRPGFDVRLVGSNPKVLKATRRSLKTLRRISNR